MHYDEINISPLMVYKKVGTPICKIKHKKAIHVKTLNYLREHEDEIFECFLNNKIILYDNEEHRDNLAMTQTTIIYPPIRFAVEFKDDFATLHAIIP